MRWCADGDFLRNFCRVQHISDLHSKFALATPCVEVIVDIQYPLAENIGEEKKKKEEEEEERNHRRKIYSLSALCVFWSDMACLPMFSIMLVIAVCQCLNNKRILLL